MKRSRRRSRDTPALVPAVLPQIIAEVASEDFIVLTVNGQRLAGSPTRRDELGRVLGEFVTRFNSPTRIEVRELDGSVWADILTPHSPELAPETVAPAPMPWQPRLVELNATGFVPGEDVAIALVLRHTSAAADGSARALLEHGEHAKTDGEVVLLGRISGTTAVCSIS
ncbi:hypothetical protein ACTJI8_05725 [Microbacterium sp. 22303]|uniref:hypothetical protein n=1 Tax=Microbacterium sp. 22303 TaxID=3453905 RepID=UPI003F8513F5